MERMGVEYQRFDGKEYVSLRRYYNLLCKCETLEQENKNLKENSLLGQATMEEAYNRIIELEEENETLKDNVEFLHSCLDDRDKSIAIMQEENKTLKEENNRLKNNAMEDMRVQTKLEEENKNLKEKVKYYKDKSEFLNNVIVKYQEENKQLKDKFMLKLAEAFLLPPTSNQMAEYKKWNYSKWYDEIKNQMRKEIKEGK